MNIGDRVNVNLLLEVESMERDFISKETYITGRIKNQNDHYLFVRVPMIACEVVNSKIENVMKEAYLDAK